MDYLGISQQRLEKAGGYWTAREISQQPNIWPLIEGLIEKYQDTLQIKLTRAELDETAPLELFIVGTRHNIDELEDQFWDLMNKVQHPGLQALLHDCFTNAVVEQFRRWPAAVRHHGAVGGGLLEHT